MGWIGSLSAPADGSAQSINVALITTLGTVLVALVVLAGQWLNSRGARTSSSPPEPSSHIGERIAVTEVRTADNARTLDVLDRHVEGVDDRIDAVISRQDRMEWQLADLLAWRDEHRRNHGLLP